MIFLPASGNSVSPALTAIYAAKALRTFGFGLSSVVFALFLKDCGFNAFEIGAVLSATLLVDALATLFVSYFAERIGRKKVLLFASSLILLSGLALAFSRNPLLIAIASIAGIISPQGYEGGPFGALEQALVSEMVPAEQMSRAYSVYNLLGFAGAALGALLAGLLFPRLKILPGDNSYFLTFSVYAGVGLILLLLYAFTKLERNSAAENKHELSAAERKLVWKRLWSLSLLQGLDAFGGGLIPQTLIAYWFLERYHAGPEFTGPLFFLTNLLAAASFFAAPYICRRFGLLNTMVFTHLPCSLSLCLLPFLPTAFLSGALLIARSLLSSMDIPARQAYSMALVEEKDRSAAAGMTTATRSIGQCAAPIFSGIALSGSFAGLPFVYAGACKTVYDLALYLVFKKVPLFVKGGA